MGSIPQFRSGRFWVSVHPDEDFQVTEGLKAGRALVEDRFDLDGKNERRVSLNKLRADPDVEEVDFSEVSAWLTPVVDQDRWD